MTAEDFAPPPSADEMLHSMRRESFYEHAAKITEQRLHRVYGELMDVRESLRVATLRAKEREAELGAWAELAYRFGTQLDAQKRAKTHDLHGEVIVAADLIAMGGRDAIDQACIGLAKKLRALVPQSVVNDL